MKLIHRRSREATESKGGFTLIETLIAITIVSLTGVSVFTISSDIARFSKKIKELNSWNRELIKLERVLRESAGEVRIPFWTGDVELTEEAGRLIIPYWKGNEDLFLELKFEDSSFSVTTPLESNVFKGYDCVELDLLKDSNYRIIGVSLGVKKNKREGITLDCVFGSIGRDLFNEK